MRKLIAGLHLHKAFKPVGWPISMAKFKNKQNQQVVYLTLTLNIFLLTVCASRAIPLANTITCK